MRRIGLIILLVLIGCGAAPPRDLASADALIASYEQNGVIFHSAPLADGTPRLTGVASDGLLVAEFVGPRERPRHAALIVSERVDRAEALMTSFTHALMPDWREGEAWIARAITAPQAGSFIVVDSRRVELQHVEEGGDRVLLLIIRRM